MKKFLLVLAFAGVARCANAATVSFFQNFGPTSIGSPLFSVTLPKFNPALGTLTKVTLTLDGQTSGSTLEFDNEAGVGGTVGLRGRNDHYRNQRLLERAGGYSRPKHFGQCHRRR